MHRLEEDIEIDLEKIWWEGVHRVYLVQDG
jgi:hypothetical protein